MTMGATAEELGYDKPPQPKSRWGHYHSNASIKDRLQGQWKYRDSGAKVNGLDCSTIVSTFSL